MLRDRIGLFFASLTPTASAQIALVLFATAIVNLFTKQAATIAGVSFSLVFFGIFTFSERHALRAAGEYALVRCGHLHARKMRFQLWSGKTGRTRRRDDARPAWP